MNRKLFVIMGWLFFSTDVFGVEEFHPVWSARDIAAIQTFTVNQKIVGTHYFYWYEYPDFHFFDNAQRTDDSLQDHFLNPEDVSFNSVAWHEKQLEDCIAAGIDFIIPVYWGVVDNYFQRGIDFSVRGLGPLQRAMELRERAGKYSPKIGMFYDTSTLLPGIRGVVGRTEKYDLTQPLGKDIFYRTIRDFFYQIHPRYWAAVGKRPIVVLYGSSFAQNHDQSTIDYVYQQFTKDFGVRPYVIKDSSWRFKSDETTSWGAALSGANIFGRVAQIGPGYNDSAVPGRTTPIRDRENGKFYRKSWNQVINSTAKIVLLETWSEMHEGTDICESKEYGRQYIDITKEYGGKFKRDERTTEEIVLEHPDLIPRPSSDEGSEYKDAKAVQITLGNTGKSQGIKLIRDVEDGRVENALIGEADCTVTVKADHGYMYFSVVDPFYFDQKIPLEIEYTYWDDEYTRQGLEYDSHDRSATLQGAYKLQAQVSCTHKKQWVTRIVKIQDARFVNRENGGADFRFFTSDGRLAIREVIIRKLSSAE